MESHEHIRLAREMVDALDNSRLVSLPSSRDPGLTFEDAYLVGYQAAQLREDRGELPVGRKIGYTNRSIWAQYNMDQPIWGHVYDSTVQYSTSETAILPISTMVAPRIEPEIAFKLRAPVLPGCDDPIEVLASVEWMARSVEVVDCHYADWKFRGPDSVIDFAHHAALVVGEPVQIDSSAVAALRDCRVTLLKDGEVVDSGVGANALGHPLLALAHLADVLASQSFAAPLGPGEVITTGTLTAAMPVVAGETWRTETDGLPFPPLAVRFE